MADQNEKASSAPAHPASASPAVAPLPTAAVAPVPPAALPSAPSSGAHSAPSPAPAPLPPQPAAALASAPALTVEEAVAEAREHNPQLRALRRQGGVAEGAETQARALSNPELELDWLHIQNVRTEKAWAAELSWAPPRPGAYGASVNAAKSVRQAVALEVAEAELDLAMSVQAAHAQLLALAEKRALVVQAVARRQEIARLLQKRIAAGAATRLDLNLAELATAQWEATRDELDAQVLDAGRQLATLLGRSGQVTAKGTLPEAPPPPALEVLGAWALEARPLLRAGEARVRGRDEELRRMEAIRWPWFELVGRYRSNETREHANDWMAGAQISLPVFDTRRGDVQAATALRDREEDVLQGAAASIRRDLAFARAQLTLRQDNLARFRATVAGSLDTREELLSAAARGGQLDVVAWLTAEDVITRSRQTHSDLRLAQHQAWLAMERAVGRPLPREASSPVDHRANAADDRLRPPESQPHPQQTSRKETSQ